MIPQSTYAMGKALVASLPLETVRVLSCHPLIGDLRVGDQFELENARVRRTLKARGWIVDSTTRRVEVTEAGVSAFRQMVGPKQPWPHRRMNLLTQ